MDIDLFHLTIEQKFALVGIVVVVVGYFFLKPPLFKRYYWDPDDDGGPAWFAWLSLFYLIFRHL